MKKLFSFSIIFAFACSIIYILFFDIKIPNNPYKFNEEICLHFEPNIRSGQYFLIFSYYCNSEPDWEKVMDPPLYVIHGVLREYEEYCDTLENNFYGCGYSLYWNDLGVIDSMTSPECPIIEINNDEMRMRQSKLCFLSHGIDKTDHLIYISEGGYFV